MRQRLDAKSAELRKLTDELSLRLLERTASPITAHQGYLPVREVLTAVGNVEVRVSV